MLHRQCSLNYCKLTTRASRNFSTCTKTQRQHRGWTLRVECHELMGAHAQTQQATNLPRNITCPAANLAWPDSMRACPPYPTPSRGASTLIPLCFGHHDRWPDWLWIEWLCPVSHKPIKQAPHLAGDHQDGDGWDVESQAQLEKDLRPQPSAIDF